MRRTRIFVDLELRSGARVTLPAAASAHLLRVLRLRAGAELTLFDGRGGEYEAVLLDGRSDGAAVQVESHRDIERESPLAITLLQGIARGERMDTVMQKAVELGVTRIVPVSCEFSVVRLDAAQAGKRVAHWQAIVIGACEQCGRNRVPELSPIVDLSRAVTDADTASARLLLAPEGERAMSELARVSTGVTLLVGPEGGLSPREQLLAVRAGFTACRLGPRVLRTETAPLAALAVLQALAGDLG